MFDYTYMALSDETTYQRLLNNPLLNFGTAVNTQTGEIKGNSSTAKYHGLTVVLKRNNYIELKGSLHKFFNSRAKGKDDNADMFRYADLKQAIGYIDTELGISPSQAVIHAIEFAYNVTTLPQPTKDVIRAFIACKNKSFSRMKIEGKGNGIEVYFNEYGIKVYDKGVQYGLPNDVMRFERKALKMRSCFNRALVLSNLLDISVWDECAGMLKTSLDGIIFTDDFTDAVLTKPQNKLIAQCENPRMWEDVNRDKRTYLNKRFSGLIQSKGKYRYRDFLRCEFDNVYSQLLNVENIKSYNISTSLEKTKVTTFSPFKYTVKRLETGSNNTGSFKGGKTGDFGSEKNNNITSRFCTVTGLPMTLETDSRKTMICIGVTTVRYLKNSTPETYDLLRVRFLSKTTKGYSSREPDEVSKIAKQIRNQVSNAKRYRDRAKRYQSKEQLSCF